MDQYAAHYMAKMDLSAYELAATRELISATFDRRYKANAKLEGSLVGGLRMFRTGPVFAFDKKVGLGFACVQRHPDTGEYRQIVSVYAFTGTFREVDRDTFITPWQSEHPGAFPVAACRP